MSTSGKYGGLSNHLSNILVSESLHCCDHGMELPADICERVFHFRRDGLILFAFNQTVFFELFELNGKCSVCHFRHFPEKLIEAHRSVFQIIQGEERHIYRRSGSGRLHRDTVIYKINVIGIHEKAENY